MIRKGKASKPNEFGKMVKIQEAENQLIMLITRYLPGGLSIVICWSTRHRRHIRRQAGADAAVSGGRRRVLLSQPTNRP